MKFLFKHKEKYKNINVICRYNYGGIVSSVESIYQIKLLGDISYKLILQDVSFYEKLHTLKLPKSLADKDL